MNKLFGLLSILFLASCAPKYYSTSPSKTSEFKGRYAEYLAADEKEVLSGYHYIISTNSDGAAIARTFFPDTKQITSLTTYKDKELKIKHGIEKYWYDDGSRKSEGQFKDDKMDGEWKRYHFGSDELSAIGHYTNGEATGKWQYFHTKKRKRTEFTFINGMKEGSFIEYDTLANITNEGIYKADTIFQQSNPQNLAVAEEMPFLSSCKNIEDQKERGECSSKTMLESIYRNIRYPEKARRYEIEGSALIRFVIDKDGSMQDIKVLTGLCKEIKEECLRVVQQLPDWEPGKQDGKAVRVYFYLPIKFRLE